MLVKMTRDAKAHPESHDANVAPEQVAEFEVMGWRRADALTPAQTQALDRDGDGAAGGAPKGGNRRKKAG